MKTACLDLCNAKKIDQETYSFVRPEGEKCPVLYGLPKLHKNGIPMRPITDYRHTPGHKLSIFLKRILKCLISRHPYTLKNSYKFIEQIDDLKSELLLLL